MSTVTVKVRSAPIKVRVAGAQGTPAVALLMKPPVANEAALPASGNSTNDGRVTNDTGMAYRWTGSSWILVGPFQGPQGEQGETGEQGPEGSGVSDIPPTALPPSNPRNGQPWIESGTLILSIWVASENAWIVPAVNAIPTTAFRSPSGSPYLSPSGAYYLAAA